MKSLSVETKKLEDYELLALFGEIEDYESQAWLLEKVAKEYNTTVGKLRYILSGNGMYIKKTHKSVSKDKAALLDAFGIISGKKMPSMQNMTLKDLKTLWSFFNKENDKFEVK